MSRENSNGVAFEKLFDKTGSMYKLVILAAKRALELSNGSPKLVETNLKEKPPLTALREIAGGKVALKAKKKPKD